MTKILEIEIEGVAPLLMHRFHGDDNAGQRKTGRKDYSLEVEDALYKNSKGEIFVPATWIEGCLTKTASEFQISGRGKKTYKDLVKSALLVTPTEIKIEPQEWQTDTRAVIVQRSRVIRYRPRWDEWKLKFSVNILDDQLPTSIIKDMLEQAGAYRGIGDFRPKFGRFQLTKIEEKKKNV